MCFYVLQVSFEQIYFAFAEKLEKVFRTRLKERTFAFVGKRLEHLKAGEVLFGHRPKALSV